MNHLIRLIGRLACGGAAVVLLLSSCTNTVPPKPVAVPRYSVLPPRTDLPAYFHNTIFEKTETQNLGPLLASNYSLVVNLDGTGDSTAPTPVRQYIIKQMSKRGFGSAVLPGFENEDPEKVLQDKRVAIVRVDGLIPVGSRKGQTFDVQVSALDTGGNSTSSLAHGQLYSVDLSRSGADPRNPGQEVQLEAVVADSPVFVNPAYELGDAPLTSAAKQSLRYGVIMGRAHTLQDRSIILRIRDPQLSTSRIIEARINQRFQDMGVARAFDEGLVQLFTPASYKGDWGHFLGVAAHLYLASSTGFNVEMTNRLIAEAKKPNAPLLDISYAWEGIGSDAIPLITPLMSGSSPDVAYAAARAAAFIGEESAIEALRQMASTEQHPFQLAAVQTLGALPETPAIDQILRTLINADETLVRIEAYRILAERQDSSVYSRLIPGNDPATAKFILDIVPSTGKPLIYATRRGLPRIAIMGGKPALSLPVLFTAFDHRLSISTARNGQALTIFYRSPSNPAAISMASRPDIAELVARLGGDGPTDEPNLDFGYCDIVAMLQKMAADHQISAYASASDPTPVPTPFILQPLSATKEQVDEAPLIPDQPRRQSDTQPSYPDNLDNPNPSTMPSGTPSGTPATMPAPPTAALMTPLTPATPMTMSRQ